MSGHGRTAGRAGQTAGCGTARPVVWEAPVATALMRQIIYRNVAQPHPLAAHRIDSLAMFHTRREDGKQGVQTLD